MIRKITFFLEWMYKKYKSRQTYVKCPKFVTNIPVVTTSRSLYRARVSSYIGKGFTQNVYPGDILIVSTCDIWSVLVSVRTN